MIRLSSNSTLFFKLALPVFFVVLYGMITVFLLVADQIPFGNYKWVRYSNLVFYLAMLFILYKTVFQLHRIDCGPDHFVVTNYRTAYKYPYDAVESFSLDSLIIYTLGTIRFNSPSSFGKSVVFLLDRSTWDKIQEEYGQVFDQSEHRLEDNGQTTNPVES